MRVSPFVFVGVDRKSKTQIRSDCNSLIAFAACSSVREGCVCVCVFRHFEVMPKYRTAYSDNAKFILKWVSHIFSVCSQEYLHRFARLFFFWLLVLPNSSSKRWEIGCVLAKIFFDITHSDSDTHFSVELSRRSSKEEVFDAAEHQLLYVISWNSDM